MLDGSQAQATFNGLAQTDASTMFSVSGSDPDAYECSPLAAAKIRNHTCVLSPEVTQGPYYHESGHPIRQNIAEDQLGLLFLMDVGVIDIKTCLPVPNVLVDLWHANTTGHYAGHADPDPTLIWEGPAPSGIRKGLLTKFPRTNDEETWLRGAWETNKAGVAQFTSRIFNISYMSIQAADDAVARQVFFQAIIRGELLVRQPFPHCFRDPNSDKIYSTDVHTKLHTQWTEHDNGTFTTSRLIHTGQLFVDDTLNEVIDKVSRAPLLSLVRALIPARLIARAL